MNNFIIISRTFTEVTPESAEEGDFSDQGWVDEHLEVSFRELVALMKIHNDASESPIKKAKTHVCFSTYPYTACYITGTERTQSIHFHRDNTANAAKYWNWAYQFANNKKA